VQSFGTSALPLDEDSFSLVDIGEVTGLQFPILVFCNNSDAYFFLSEDNTIGYLVDFNAEKIVKISQIFKSKFLT
jgi:hypothetical protein